MARADARKRVLAIVFARMIALGLVLFTKIEIGRHRTQVPAGIYSGVWFSELADSLAGH